MTRLATDTLINHQLELFTFSCPPTISAFISDFRALGAPTRAFRATKVVCPSDQSTLTA